MERFSALSVLSGRVIEHDQQNADIDTYTDVDNAQSKVPLDLLQTSLFRVNVVKLISAFVESAELRRCMIVPPYGLWEPRRHTSFESILLTIILSADLNALVAIKGAFHHRVILAEILNTQACLIYSYDVFKDSNFIDFFDFV